MASMCLNDDPFLSIRSDDRPMVLLLTSGALSMVLVGDTDDYSSTDQIPGRLVIEHRLPWKTYAVYEDTHTVAKQPGTY